MSHARRTFLFGIAGSALTIPLIGRQSLGQSSTPVPLTPACGDDEEPTISQTEGPYFTPNSPEKRSLFADSPQGERFSIGGRVLDNSCRPVPDALIEIWHADENGAYDNDGYKLRGHQRADRAGMWSFETIVPGIYPGRTRHYHFKIQKRGGSVLTTQLYLPEEPQNRRDWIFDDRLLMVVGSNANGRIGRFDFVIE